MVDEARGARGVSRTESPCRWQSVGGCRVGVYPVRTVEAEEGLGLPRNFEVGNGLTDPSLSQLALPAAIREEGPSAITGAEEGEEDDDEQEVYLRLETREHVQTNEAKSKRRRASPT